jgi:hypothetical protein
MTTINRSTIKTRNTAVAAGIDKHIPASIQVGGATYTPQTLKAVFTSQTAALDASDALHKQWTDQVQAAQAAGATANATYLSLKSYLVGQYGADANAVLNDFGMPAPKTRGPRTVRVKAEAVTKRNATRAARHTMGKVQRKGVTGVTAAAAAAATATAPTAAPTAPASPAAPIATPTAPATAPPVTPVTSAKSLS